MAIRKTKIPKKTRNLVSLLFVVVALFVLLTFMMKGKEGLLFSCQNGNLMGLSSPRPPPACIGCIEICYGTAKAYDGKNLICTGRGSSNSVVTPTLVVISCKGIKNYVGKEIKVEYVINSSFGEFKKTWIGIINDK